MIKHQPIPESMVEFSRETSATPGARCEGDAIIDAIRAGQGCILGDTTLANTPAFVILGDSHARMWAEGLDTLGNETRQSILMLAYSSCTPILNYVPPTRRACATIIKEALDAVIHSPIKQVVLAGYWVDAVENIKRSEGSSPQSFQTWLKETASALHNAGKSVYFLFDIPELESESTPRQAFIQSLRTPEASIAPITLASHKKRQIEITGAVTALQDSYDIHLLSPDTYLCPNAICLVAEHGRTLYRDKHHLTDAASRRFRKIFESLLTSDL